MKKDKEDNKRKAEVETPRPPQVMDPSKPPRANDNDGATKEEVTEGKDEQRKPKPEKKKLLGESPLEIDDETTI